MAALDKLTNLTLDKSSMLTWESSCLNSVKAAALKKVFLMCVCMECISTCVNSACLWEHQNSLDQSDMRYIEQVPSDICYWVVLSTPNGVNHIDRLNYISRDIFLPSSKGHLQSQHIHCLLKVSSSGAGCIEVLHRAWRKDAFGCWERGEDVVCPAVPGSANHPDHGSVCPIHAWRPFFTPR